MEANMKAKTLVIGAAALALTLGTAAIGASSANAQMMGGYGGGYGPGYGHMGGGYGLGYGHMRGYYGEQGYSPRTGGQGWGYGPGWMHGWVHGGYGPGRGYGPGWMHGWMHGGYGPGRGYGPGWMHGGYGPGWCWRNDGYYGAGRATQPDLNLTVDQVKARMERWLAYQGNPHLKLGDVKEKDANTITADIVTADNSLVQRFVIDRDTGYYRPADEEPGQPSEQPAQKPTQEPVQQPAQQQDGK